MVAGVALFVGYKIGIKDGFRGGVQTGRLLERSHADEERRFLTARLVHAQAELHAQADLHRLPPEVHPAESPQAGPDWSTDAPHELMHASEDHIVP